MRTAGWPIEAHSSVSVITGIVKGVQADEADTTHQLLMLFEDSAKIQSLYNEHLLPNV